MRQYHWLRNVLRNKFHRTFIGKALANLTTNEQQSICFVSATRLNEKDFWSKSLLGRSLRPRLNQTTVKGRIAFENTRGLPEVYNDAIREESADILVFLHDDVWLEDTQLMQKIRAALKFNDVVGVAGNTKRLKGQPTWAFLQGKSGELQWAPSHHSGGIKHGSPGRCTLSNYGPTPALCELMDGVFLASQRKTLIESKVFFGEEFKFHFYDMDFCRTARKMGLSLSTWPIDLIHLSPGEFNSESWKKWNQYISRSGETNTAMKCKKNRVAAICMIKDECDIIESFIRINLQSVDHIYIIDHNSNDNTKQILELLAAEGLPITIEHNLEIDHNQARNLGKLLTKIANQNTYQFIVPLDADEFIPAQQKPFGQILSEEILAGHCGQMKWITFVPHSESSTTTSLHDRFRARDHEPEQYFKTIIPNDIAKMCDLSEGNHLCLTHGQAIAACTISTPLIHVPIRSAPQLIKKALIGSHKLSIKPNRLPGEGFHWDHMAEHIREKNYDVTESDLQHIALRYAAPTHSNPRISDNPLRIGSKADQNRYTALSQVNLIGLLDAFSTELCEEINKIRRHTHNLNHPNKPNPNEKPRPRLINILKRLI